MPHAEELAMATDAGRAFSVRGQTGFGTVALVCFGFLYLPMVLLVIYAFNAGENIAVWDGFSLRWFAAAWQNGDVQAAALRSLYVAFFAALIATIVATLAAIATTRTEPYPGLTFKYAMINQPLMVPEIVLAVALLIVFSRLKVWTGYSGIGYMLLAHAAFCIPFAYLPIRARLENMDLTLERAAADLYATPWMVFRRVTFPLLVPGIVAGFMLAFVISLDDVVITEFVKSAGQETLPTYMLGQLRREVTPEVNAVATAFLALSVVLVTLFYFINRKKT
jgi:spermidine/putrescine transport system permease protein